MQRDINWSVDFEVTINGKKKDFDELTDSEREHILSCIAEDYYSGTFLGDEEEEEE